MDDWAAIKYFKPEEFGNDEAQSKMHSTFIWLLDNWRDSIGCRVIIHEAYATSGHEEKSYHYTGEAIDGHLETLNGKPISLFDQFMFILRYGCFRGVGIYPSWNKQGFHIDTRKTQMTLTWWRDVNGKYHYNDERFILKKLLEV